MTIVYAPLSSRLVSSAPQSQAIGSPSASRTVKASTTTIADTIAASPETTPSVIGFFRITCVRTLKTIRAASSSPSARGPRKTASPPSVRGTTAVRSSIAPAISAAHSACRGEAFSTK